MSRPGPSVVRFQDIDVHLISYPLEKNKAFMNDVPSYTELGLSCGSPPDAGVSYAGHSSVGGSMARGRHALGDPVSFRSASTTFNFIRHIIHYGLTLFFPPLPHPPPRSPPTSTMPCLGRSSCTTWSPWTRSSRTCRYARVEGERGWGKHPRLNGPLSPADSRQCKLVLILRISTLTPRFTAPSSCRCPLPSSRSAEWRSPSRT